MKSLKLIKVAAALAGLAVVSMQLTGCSTMRGKSQQVNVETKPAGAICTLSNDVSSATVKTALHGTTAVVPMSRAPLQVKCTKGKRVFEQSFAFDPKQGGYPHMITITMHHYHHHYTTKMAKQVAAKPATTNQ